MIVSLLVPSFRRHLDLERCLYAIAKQTRATEQAVIVARAGDTETFKVLEEWHAKLPLEIVEVTEPGQVYALNAGLARCQGDVVAITDDDTAPRPDWLARIEAHFEADEQLGGLGGRDWVHQNSGVEMGQRKLVGKILWFGRVIGNHHLGAGPAREVDILKGANCAFRMSAIGPIGFDTRLRGVGAEVHNDMSASIAVKRAGWRVLYDPEVAVDHYPAKRADVDRDQKPDGNAVFDNSFNAALALSALPTRRQRLAAQAWAAMIGARVEPGLFWAIRLAMRRESNAYELWQAARAGRGAAGRL